ncbi:MAG: caspase family protein [Bryobacterales bacterium]|nr:caspase family protein [Bryobacterales bacterium]
MPKGRSLHIGLNSVDPGHYQGWSGPLVACEADANAMLEIAVKKGYQPVTLLTTSATRASVSQAILDAAASLDAGDIFFLSYSGHGGQLPDWSGDEPDLQDETWCLWDGELVDDELNELLTNFKAGVRILTLSDSCHSGSVVKLAHYRNRQLPADLSQRQHAYRAMPPDVALAVYQANRKFYDPILKNEALKDVLTRVKASVLLLSGCQDNQLSMDGAFNGLFTGTLLRVWRDGAFKHDYRRFHSQILATMPPDQSPAYFTEGAPNPAFERQRPFQI